MINGPPNNDAAAAWFLHLLSGYYLPHYFLTPLGRVLKGKGGYHHPPSLPPVVLPPHLEGHLLVMHICLHLSNCSKSEVSRT